MTQKASSQAILQNAQKALKTESEAISNLISYLNEDFCNAVRAILKCRGKVVFTGIGKSAIIAQKISATFNSTGTPAVFMHAADAIHGDLGTITSEDIVLCISKSGDTPEIKVLIPLLKAGGNLLIGLVGNTHSALAKRSDLVLNATVHAEACPNNLAPTSSTTAQLAMGDALAICILMERGFSAEDFAKFHPGGTLGKKLYLKVSDVATTQNLPVVNFHDSVKKVILEISAGRLGATAVMKDEKLAGIITDGDIRRSLEKSDQIANVAASEIMNSNPKTIELSELAVNAMEIMQANNIMQLPVLNQGVFCGFIHMHDLLREGLF